MVVHVEISETVASLFEEARERRGEPYERDRFLAHLTVPAARVGKRCQDTFGGRRRFVRFMNAVEMAFGICFTNEEWERGYGMEEFVALVAAKIPNLQTALRLAEKRLKQSQVDRFDTPVKFAAVLSPLLVGAVIASNVYFKALLALAYLLAVGGAVVMTRRGYSYAAMLVDRIRQRTGACRPPQEPCPDADSPHSQVE